MNSGRPALQSSALSPTLLTLPNGPSLDPVGRRPPSFRRSLSGFGSFFSQPWSLLPPSTTLSYSPSSGLSIPTTGRLYNDADRQEPLKFTAVVGEPLSGSIPASSGHRSQCRHRCCTGRRRFYCHRSLLPSTRSSLPVFSLALGHVVLPITLDPHSPDSTRSWSEPVTDPFMLTRPGRLFWVIQTDSIALSLFFDHFRTVRGIFPEI